ncbi:MAG: hypothetical protein IKV72_00855 [Firmicutes bacterium]|nr:hypothetical protein [Bacillota bacterium]MBR5488224.1 hypothetical protein [Bacillota bacterium]
MKKKLLTLFLSGVLVLGTVGGASAAEKNGCSLNPALSGNLQNLLQQYLSKYFEQSVPEKPEGTEKPESPEKPEKPDNSVTQKPQQNAGTKASQVVNLVNQQRQKAGLSGLKSDSELTRLAQLKAEDMAAKGYFSHTSPTYGSAFDMLKKAGYSYRTAGENIAMGQKTAETVMNGWMNSSGHRANILGSGYTKIGVGYAVNAKGTPYWVQIFAG